MRTNLLHLYLSQLSLFKVFSSVMMYFPETYQEKVTKRIPNHALMEKKLCDISSLCRSKSNRDLRSLMFVFLGVLI